MPRGDVSSYEKKADLLVCVLNRYGTQIPGKLYYCASTCKPVLVILDGDEIQKMKDFLLTFDRFYLCENNENSIRNTVLQIMEDSKEWGPCPLLNEEAIAKKVLES